MKALFSYKAIMPCGQIKQGRQRAVSQEALTAALHAKGYALLETQKIAAPTASFYNKGASRSFARALGNLLVAKVPIKRALEVIAAQYAHKTPGVSALATEVLASLMKGYSTTQAFISLGPLFDSTAHGLLNAAQANGRFAQALLTWVHLEEKKIQARKKALQMALYPAIVLVSAIAVALALSLLVLPGIAKILSASGQPLPLCTRIVLGSGQWLASHWMFFIASLAGLGGLLAVGQRQASVKRLLSRWTFCVPLYGRYQKTAQLSQFSRYLAELIRSGVPILEALRLSGQALSPASPFQAHVATITASMNRGLTLGESCRGCAQDFPAEWLCRIEVGQQTATLADSLEEASLFYENEAQHLSLLMLKLLEPALILGLAAIVSTVGLCVLVPLLDLASKMG